MIKRFFVLDTKVANLSRTSTFQSIYSVPICATVPLFSAKIRLPSYPPHLLIPNFVPKIRRRRIFIRFLCLRSFLIKDSSADSITCFTSQRKKSKRFRLWNIQIEFQMEIEGVIAFILWPLREGKSSSSALKREIYQANYSRPRVERKKYEEVLSEVKVRWSEMNFISASS